MPAREPNPQLVLCNGAKLTSRKQAWGRAIPLGLTTGEGGNVRIKVRDIIDQLTTNVDALAADLLEIAAFVYVADQAVHRTGKKEINYGAKWYRNFRFEIAVREPDFWNQVKMRDALVSMLDFLSGDTYEFAFGKNRDPAPHSQYLDYGKANPNPEGVKRVVLFSGGLDSLAGAVEEVFEHKRRIALVSHKPVSHIATRQNTLVSRIVAGILDPRLHPVHVSVTANKKGELESDHAQRTRSFLYATMGAVVARLFDLNDLYFYENGVMSINLPLAGHELGARATRTTHPLALAGFQDIFSLVFGKPFRVRNEYLGLTKQDVVERLKRLGHSALATDSVSCMHTRQTTQGQPHCAMCSQCVSRRFATLGAGFGADDPPQQYKADVLLAPRKTTVDRTIAERFIGLAHEVESMTSADDFYKRYAFELSRITPYLPMKQSAGVAELFDLHRRHAEQVNVIVRAAMKAHVDDYYDKRLDPTCALMCAFSLGAPPKLTPVTPTSTGGQVAGTAYTPSKNAYLVLRALCAANVLMQQADLVAATEQAGTRLSARTIGPLLQELGERRLVEFPNGPRSGARITDEGRRLLNGADSASD